MTIYHNNTITSMDINTLFPIINADDFNRKYSVGRTIGVGKQGQVYCVTDNTTNEVFAIK